MSLFPIWRAGLLALVLTALAAVIGGWAGVRYGFHQAQARPGLDEVLHHQLGLNAEQDRRIEALEATYAGRRKSLNTEMRAANRELAAAIGTEHAYGPKAQHAVSRFHAAMGALQEETIRHVLAMREVLTSEQARRFDGTVSKALSSDPT